MISERRRAALMFATIRHEGQRDKGGFPYIIHPVAVADAVSHLGDDIYIAAVLHDTVEDTDTTFDEIEERFGKTVRDAVDSVTRRGPQSVGFHGFYTTNELYRDFVARSKAHTLGRRIKLEDVKDNSRPSRMAQLPPEQQGMITRYEKTLKQLEYQPGEMTLEDRFQRLTDLEKHYLVGETLQQFVSKVEQGFRYTQPEDVELLLLMERGDLIK